MIIYRRKDNDVVIPCGLGPVVCPDTSHDLQMKQVDSSTVLQYVEPDSGYYGLYRVIVNPIYDANLLPDNIKEGVEILGVMGTYAGELINIQDRKSVQWSEVPTLLQWATFEPDEGYDAMRSLRLRMPKTFIQHVTPSTSAQSFRPQNIGYDYYRGVEVGAVTADIDPDIQPENIKKDVEILGVIGTYEGAAINNQSKTVNSSTSSQTVTYDSSYTGLSSVTVRPYTVEGKSQTITQNGTYTFAPTSADALSDVSISVEVAGTPATVQDKSVTYDANGEYTVTPDQGYDGLSSVTVDVSVEGQAINNQNKTVNPSTNSQSITADSGYTGLGTVTVNPYTLDTKTVNPSTNSITVNSSADGMSSVTVNAVTASIDPDIQAGNIKNGITILGVTGTYDGSGGGGGDSSLYATMHSLTVTLNDDNESTSTYVETGASLIEEPTTFEMVFKAPESEDGNKHWIFGCEHAPLRASVQLPFFGAYVKDNTLYISAGQTEDNCVALDNDTYHFSDGIYIIGEIVEDPEDAENTVWQIKINNNEDDLYYLPYETLSSYNPICIFAKDDGNGNFSEFAESRTEFMYAMIWNDDEELDFYAAGEIGKDEDGNLITSAGQTPYIMFYTYDWANDSHTLDLIAPEIGEYDSVQAQNITADYGNYYAPEAGIYMMPFGDSMPAFTEVQEINNQNKTVDSSTSSQSITADNGYSGLGTVTVNPYTVSGVNVRSTTNGGQPQVVTPMDTDAFSFVTVYPLEFQSKTVNPSTNSITVNYDQGVYDGLSSVTVNAVTASIDPDIQAGNIKKDVEILGVVGTYEGTVIDNQNKTVDPSTSGQTITADSGYTGLGTVTVNPVNAVFGSDTITQNGTYGFDGRDFGGDYINFLQIDVSVDGQVISNQNKTVNSSTSSQSVTFDSGYTGLGTVTVNPYTTETDSSTLTQNGTYTFTPQNADALSSVTIDVSVAGQAGQDWYIAWKLGNKHDMSDVDLSQVMTTYRGLYYMFSDNANPSPRYMSAPPVLDGSTVGMNGMNNAFSGVIFTNQNGTEISFPNLVTASGMYYAFSYTDGITKISFPELTSINGQQAMQHFFSEQTAGTLTEIYMPKMQNVSGQNAVSSWVDDYTTGTASRKLTVHPAALRFSADENVAYWMGNSLTDLILTATTERDIILENNPNLTAESVMNVLNAMVLNPTPDPDLGYPSCYFCLGFTVIDYPDGRIQSRYNALLSGGWSIDNLTITPYSA